MHRIHFRKAPLASWVDLHLPEGQMCQFTAGQSLRSKLANTYPTFWHETQNFRHGALLQVSREISCRHLRLRISQSKGMWNEPLEVKRLFQPGKRVLLSTEFGAEGQMRQLFAEGKWFATSPTDGRSKLENTSPTFWHEIQNCRHTGPFFKWDSDDMRFKLPIWGPFFKWTTACGMSRLQHHDIAQFFVST